MTRAARSLLSILVLAASVLSGCATVVSGNGSSGVALNASLPVINGNKGAFDQQVENALTDVMSFWRAEYPSLSGGKSLPPLTGGLYSVNGSNLTSAARRNGCIAQDLGVANNAFYCRLDDSIAWDRDPQHLVAQLGQKYGSFLIAVVFAHEFGHAIQQRLGIFAQKPPTLDTESQADCAAGAFIRSVEDGKAAHFRIDTASVDSALLGYLQVRDPPPLDSSQISHGNGFDRLGAIANGIAHGVTYCYSASYFADLKSTERPFTTDADYLTGGNEPYAQVVDADPPTSTGGGGGLQPNLNAYWKAASASVGKSWTDVKIAEAAHPRCGASAASEFGYCPDDNTVYYSTPFAMAAYDSLPDKTFDKATGSVTLVDDAPADYSLGTLFVYGWGLAVRHQLVNGSTDDQAALLAATCYAGAYSKSINKAATGSSEFTLSPPDMDEAVSAVLQLVPQDRAYGPRGTTGLQRIQYFVKGYFGGLSVC